jgi:carotenoid 1,2-hydratase
MNTRRFTLDAAGGHHWQPLSAAARIEVRLEEPALHWHGRAYLDTNWGDAPLERDFVDWDWCRAPLREGAAILYDARRRDGTRQRLALRFHPDGRLEDMDVPPDTRLPRTRWGIRRATQGAATIERTLEDTPFYARSVLRTHLCGEDATAVHESLDLDRFAALPIQLMLPFRVPRALSRS